MPCGPCAPGVPPGPWGTRKLRTAAFGVPPLRTEAGVPAGTVMVVPTCTVAAGPGVPAAPGAPGWPWGKAKLRTAAFGVPVLVTAACPLAPRVVVEPT